jgi:hypothetical protein
MTNSCWGAYITVGLTIMVEMPSRSGGRLNTRTINRPDIASDQEPSLPQDQKGDGEMPAIIRDKDTDWKYVVRGNKGEFTFDTREEAQKKANELMFEEAREKGLL